MSRIEHGEVEGLRVGRFPGKLNTACILYRVGDTIIDTGPPNMWPAVRRFLEERQVTQAVVTHHHEDHSGNLAPIRRATGAEIYSPEESLTRLAKGFPLRLYQRVLWGRPDRVKPRVVPARIPVAGGLSLTTVAAPGHSHDMTCYLEAERGWLFSGDLYVSSKTVYLRQDEDLPRHLASLRAVLQLDFNTVFCAHRGVLRDGHKALERKLDFLESFRQRVADLAQQGRSPREITRQLLGREDLMSWITGFHYSKRNLVQACLAASGVNEKG